jgi:hypothetical protein
VNADAQNGGEQGGPTRCERPAGVPRKQDEGGAATGVVTHATSPADSKIPTRGGGQRMSAKEPCVYGGVVMCRSNRMKRILREQWGHFLPSTLQRGR